MLSFLKKSNYSLYKLTFSLLGLTVLATLFIFGRVLVFKKYAYLFLIWNIFLAWVPFYISLIYTNINLKSKISKLLLSFSWIAFYPNAPYIITDFIHLSKYKFYENKPHGEVFTSNFVMWYDFFLISIFVIIGLILAYISLSLMHKHIEKSSNTIYGWIFIFTTSVLSGFAIYLGRFLRLNSWEIISSPINLVYSIISDFGIHSIVFTSMFSTLIFIFYLTFFFMNKYYTKN